MLAASANEHVSIKQLGLRTLVGSGLFVQGTCGACAWYSTFQK